MIYLPSSVFNEELHTGFEDIMVKGNYPQNCYNPKDYWQNEYPKFFELNITLDFITPKKYETRKRPRERKVQDIFTGQIFNSLQQASKFYNINVGLIKYRLRTNNKKNTLKYLDETN